MAPLPTNPGYAARCGIARAAATIISIALLIAVGGTAQASASGADYSAYDWGERVNAAERYAQKRGGTVSFGIVDENQRLRGRHVNRVHYSASTVKVMMMVAWLRHIRARALHQSDKDLIKPMITRSADDPANYIYTRLGAESLYRLARDAKMRAFKTQPIWGHSHVTVRDQAHFMWRLGRYIPDRHEAFAFRMLRSIIPSQRWGVFRAAPENWRVFAKGGFVNPGGRWRINQVAQLRRGERKMSVVVLTTDNPSISYGGKTVQGVTQRLLRGYGRLVVRR